MFPKIDSHSNIPANLKISKNFIKFQNFQKNSNNFKMIKFSKSLEKLVFIKFLNFNI